MTKDLRLRYRIDAQITSEQAQSQPAPMGHFYPVFSAITPQHSRELLR